jgi:hypothetical protein
VTFLQPWFLLGTILAVVPVLIHLWYRKRLRKIPFSALQFLKRTEARRFGWLKLREWLVLASRCLLIIFLFLGLARPHLKTSILGIGKRASVCLIMDNSYSMSYVGNFERMKNLAQQVMNRYSPNSEFCVVPLCGDQPDEIFWTTKTSAIEDLKNVRLVYKGGNIAESIARVPTEDAKYAVDYVYIGDGQSSNFQDFPAGLAEHSKFYWVAISAGNNACISDVFLRDPVAIPLQEYELRTNIANFSNRSWFGKVGVTSGDYYLEKDCEVDAGARGYVDFTLPTRLLIGRVDIFDDSLLVDNAYYFSNSLPRNLNVLLVGDSPYVLRALVPGNDSIAAFNVKSEAKIGSMDLRRYDVVILSGLRDITDVDRIKLLNHLKEPGKALVVIMGDEVGDDLRDFLSTWCSVESVVLPSGYITVDWVDRSHRVFETFDPGWTLHDVQYFRYVKVEAPQYVLANFSGGDPFIIAHDNFCLFTGLLDAQRTNFVFKNSFVPILLRMIVSLTSGQGKEYYVGDSVQIYGVVRAPNGELLNKGDLFSIPGFHVTDRETLCVNVDPGESDLRPLGKERVAILNVQQIDPVRHLMGSDLTYLFLILALLALTLELGLLLLR